MRNTSPMVKSFRKVFWGMALIGAPLSLDKSTAAPQVRPSSGIKSYQLTKSYHEGNNWIGKHRDLFKKIRDTKGTFHAKMSTIKHRNGRDLTEAEDIKKRWQGYTEELYKKDLCDLDNHDGVITHLKPDILEWEVKWALGSITLNKVSGGDGIPIELFQILKDDAVKVLYSIWKAQQWPQDWKRSINFHSNPK